jgi:hypothetical protein
MILVLMGRNQFRKKITRAMEAIKKKRESKPKEEPRRKMTKKKPKPTGFVDKARKDGSWM